MGCGAWAITLLTIVVVFVFSATFILSSIGITPVIDAGGLSWDSSAYVAHDANRTARYVVEQEQKTERNKQDNETLHVFFVVVGLASVAGLGIVQYNRTRRQQAEVELKLQMYLAYIGGNGQIGRHNGQLGVFNNARREFVPAGVALIEMDDR